MARKRRILLIEPNYKNKYPPIGLMKISSYHRQLGDRVKFYKGDLKDLVVEELAVKCIRKLKKIDSTINWEKTKDLIELFIRKKNTGTLNDLNFKKSKYSKLIECCLIEFADVFRKRQYDLFPKWDRIYVTTLFTFYWKITVETIKYAKNLIVDENQLLVGGVLASLLHKELEAEVGITPMRGLLDKPGMLDPDNEKAKQIIIDNLPLDYSILDEIEYKYPTGSAYFTFMTKGCTRKCAFCSVPILEPTYKPKIDTVDKFEDIKRMYGEQQNLLLMDNNVLASPNFPEIIAEIKQMGFYKGATFSEPNQLAISIRNLKKGINDHAYIKRSFYLFNEHLKRLRGSVRQTYYNSLVEYELLHLETATKENLIAAYDALKDIYDKYRKSKPQLRYVDFNQGTDARYVNDEMMKLMSEIPIRPLRIAFDYWGIRDKYENAVRLAAKYGLKELSNYILYNFNDSPEELYRRLEINVRLNEELGTHIFSFPMKYIPLFGEDAKSRDYIGKKWNRKFIRAIQSILNVTKGIVAPGRSFFEKAFGSNEDIFFEILYMPEAYIVYRYFFDGLGFTDEWRKLYNSLQPDELTEAQEIIKSNDFKEVERKTSNKKIIALLRHYNIKKESVENIKLKDLKYKETKKKFDLLVKEDNAINLTLTYDFEAESATSKKKKRAIPR
ncbi:hypothetical protein [Flaviaesturariibacter amylovorans]|uniref:Radical SAM protein n=1 Tax=Flaviaesturariibacter amylovorans TaxID=1084520 RepID=A0ABP8HIM1_9BACT